MKFDWDASKNRGNIRKHGLDFADAEEMFGGVLVVELDTREDYGEKRWRGIGTMWTHDRGHFHRARRRYHSHHLAEKGRS